MKEVYRRRWGEVKSEIHKGVGGGREGGEKDGRREGEGETDGKREGSYGKRWGQIEAEGGEGNDGRGERKRRVDVSVKRWGSKMRGRRERGTARRLVRRAGEGGRGGKLGRDQEWGADGGGGWGRRREGGKEAGEEGGKMAVVCRRERRGVKRR